MKKPNCQASDKVKKDIIAQRKKCKTSGTGLSHYILEKK